MTPGGRVVDKENAPGGSVVVLKISYFNDKGFF